MRAVLGVTPLVVEIDGAALDDERLRELATARVRQRLSAPTACELSFRGAAGVVPGELAAPGSELTLSALGHDEPLFTGDVTAVEHVYGPGGEHTLAVRAYDPLHRLRKSQRARALTEVTVEELAGELAAPLGLTVDAAEPGPLWQNLVQHRQTDLELLVVLAQRCGLYATVRGDVLHLLTLEGDGDALPLTLGEELLEARVELNGDRVVESVSAVGWDVLAAEPHSATASTPRSGRRVGAAVTAGSVGGTGELTLLDEHAGSDDHAAGLAQAELDARTAGAVTLWGLAEGDPRLRPGARVQVSGLRPDLDGEHVLTDVTHTADEQRGFVSAISTAPPEPRERPAAAVAALGQVTSVDDPESRGRVRVKMPAYGDVESDWLGVVTPAGGPDKGVVALPDVDDSVLVVLTHQDPAAGVVVGGLYGSGGPPDPGVTGGSVRRYTFRTPGGQFVLLDDEKRTVRLEDSTGSSIELSPERLVVHSAVDLTIEAPARAIVVRAMTVDFQQAT